MVERGSQDPRLLRLDLPTTSELDLGVEWQIVPVSQVSWSGVRGWRGLAIVVKQFKRLDGGDMGAMELNPRVQPGDVLVAIGGQTYVVSPPPPLPLLPLLLQLQLAGSISC